jgi:hypothetical protein
MLGHDLTAGAQVREMEAERAVAQDISPAGDSGPDTGSSADSAAVTTEPSADARASVQNSKIQHPVGQASLPVPVPDAVACLPGTGRDACPTDSRPILDGRSSESTAVSSSASIRTNDGGNRYLLDENFAAIPASWLNQTEGPTWRPDAGYLVTTPAGRQYVTVAAPLAQPLGDVAVTALFQKTSGPPGSGYGLMVRTQDIRSSGAHVEPRRFLLFEVNDAGRFGVWRRDGDSWIDVQPWQSSSAVKSGGAPNELSVAAAGERLVFTVNGVRVTEITDSALFRGGVGILVGGEGNVVRLARFAVEAL